MYAEPVRAQGLVFMDTPGYDPVSATGQVAGGANLICFTTGRGYTYGCKPVPSLKLASNSAMFRRMALAMDFDCGGVVDGRQSIADAGAQLFRLCWKRLRAAPRPAKSTAWATTSSCPGSWARLM